MVFEAGNGTDVLKNEISDKYCIPYKNLLFCETHNHSAPKVGIKPNELATKGDYSSNEKMGVIVHDAALKAVEHALQTMRPARYGYGEGKSYINVNRDFQLEDGTWTQSDNWEGMSDKTLAVMKFVDENDNLIAALLNHCTHANTTFLGKDLDGKTKICGDFPGFTCDFLEKRYGGEAVVLWTSGAAGNQNAIQCYRGDNHYVGEETVNYPEPNGNSYRYAQYLGEIHAIDADKILKQIVCASNTLQLKSAVKDIFFDEQVPPAGVDFSLQILTAQNAIRTIARLFPDKVKDGKIIRQEPPVYLRSNKKLPCEMQIFLIGSTAIITAAAELYNELGFICKKYSPLRNTFIITNTGGHGNRVGYIQDDNSASNLTFQHYDKVFPGDSDKIVLDGMNELFSEIFG